MVLLLLTIGNSHFRLHFIVTKYLMASMIIGTELLDSQLRAVWYMEGIVETSRGIVRIYGWKKPTVESGEANVGKQRLPGKTTGR